jgi:cytochrome c peroxidase
LGAVWDIRTAVAIMAIPQLGVDLNYAEINAITTFHSSLTGEVPEIVYPIRPPEIVATPHPSSGVIP